VSFNNILFDVGSSVQKFVGCKMKLTSDATCSHKKTVPVLGTPSIMFTLHYECSSVSSKGTEIARMQRKIRTYFPFPFLFFFFFFFFFFFQIIVSRRFRSVSYEMELFKY